MVTTKAMPRYTEVFAEFAKHTRAFLQKAATKNCAGGVPTQFFIMALSPHLTDFWRKNTARSYEFCSVTDTEEYAPSQNTCLSCIFLAKSFEELISHPR